MARKSDEDAVVAEKSMAAWRGAGGNWVKGAGAVREGEEEERERERGHGPALSARNSAHRAAPTPPAGRSITQGPPHEHWLGVPGVPTRGRPPAAGEGAKTEQELEVEKKRRKKGEGEHTPARRFGKGAHRLRPTRTARGASTAFAQNLFAMKGVRARAAGRARPPRPRRWRRPIERRRGHERGDAMGSGSLFAGGGAAALTPRFSPTRNRLPVRLAFAREGAQGRSPRNQGSAEGEF